MTWPLINIALMIAAAAIGYYLGYCDARNRFERSQAVVFTPQEIYAITAMADQVERELEITKCERMWNNET